MDDEIEKILRRPKKWKGKPPSPLQPQWKKKLKKIPTIEGEPEIESPEEKQPTEPNDWCCEQAKKYLHYMVLNIRAIDEKNQRGYKTTDGTGKVLEERPYNEKEREQIRDTKAAFSESMLRTILDMDCEDFVKYIYSSYKSYTNNFGPDFAAITLFYEECKEDGYQGTAEQWHTKDNWIWGEIERSEMWDLVKSKDTISKRVRQWHKKLDKWMAEHNDWRTAAQCMAWFIEIRYGSPPTLRAIAMYLSTRKYYESKSIYFSESETATSGRVNEYRIITDNVSKASPIIGTKTGTPSMRTKLKPIPEKKDTNCREELLGIVNNINTAPADAIVKEIHDHDSSDGFFLSEKAPIAKTVHQTTKGDATLSDIPEEVCCEILQIMKEYRLDVPEELSTTAGDMTIRHKIFYGPIVVNGKETDFYLRLGPYHNQNTNNYDSSNDDGWDFRYKRWGGAERNPTTVYTPAVYEGSIAAGANIGHMGAYSSNMGFSMVLYKTHNNDYHLSNVLHRFELGIYYIENILVRFSNKLRWW